MNLQVKFTFQSDLDKTNDVNTPFDKLVYKTI
jgi:hypothetical protein